MVIRESVEPLLDDYKPPGIASLKFSKLSLGHVSPKIEGFISFFYISSLAYFFFQNSRQLPTNNCTSKRKTVYKEKTKTKTKNKVKINCQWC